MKRFLVIAALFLVATAGCAASQSKKSEGSPSSEPFTFRVLATGLADPGEITWGPDNSLWITEKAGKRVTRVNPSDGSKTTVITIADVYSSESQDGPLGMAFHPDFPKGSGTNYVYLAYTYDANPGPGVDRRAKIARYTYDPAVKTPSQPVNPST